MEARDASTADGAQDAGVEDAARDAAADVTADGPSGAGGAAGASGSGGRAGSGGVAGTGGSGGRAGTGGGAAGGRGGAGSGGAAGSTGGSGGGPGGCPGVFCEDFERGTLGNTPNGWVGMTEWETFQDDSMTLAYTGGTNGTLRFCYASAAPGAPWSGATSISGRVKVLSLGAGPFKGAMLCLRYTGGSNSDFYCALVEPNVGVRIRTRVADTIVDGTPSGTIGSGWHDVKLTVDAAGSLTAYLGTTMVATMTPSAAIPAGYAAVGVVSANAAFDDIVVTQP
jgi:hypothetical protein